MYGRAVSSKMIKVSNTFQPEPPVSLRYSYRSQVNPQSDGVTSNDGSSLNPNTVCYAVETSKRFVSSLVNIQGHEIRSFPITQKNTLVRWLRLTGP